MDLLQRFRESVQQQNLFYQKDKLILAVSGGVDSVVLCELCKEAGYDFVIAHCNFQLRGEESSRDETFVRGLGKKYGTEVFVKKFDTEKYALENKIGIQEAARDLRYAWFEELRQEKKFSFLLLAHHANDNIETALMNYCRGTGLRGLEGMPAISANIRRPLLAFWKEELIEFAKKNRLEFVEDTSNKSSKYTRNLFRNEIIPLISKAYPQATSNLQDNIDRFKEVGRLYDLLTTEFKKKLCKIKNDEVYIPVKQLMSYQNKALIFEIISDYGFTEKQVEEVAKLAESESGKFIQSPNASVRIIKFRNWFIISKHESRETTTFVVEAEAKQLKTQSGQMKIERIPFTPDYQLPTADYIACLDADEISFPLILRRMKQGDYFYPLGMRKKKKLARFFIDQKLSKPDREKIWVLEMNKKILWVVGLRIDDRFKITDKTKSILKISLHPS